MFYFQVIDTISVILLALCLIYLIQRIFYAIVGVFANKKFPKANKQLKYGIIISARNEENVIVNLLDSIKNLDYPKDKVVPFVIAHNCSDNTAKIARDNGAICYEYFNEKEKTVGYAYKHIFECIKRDYKLSDFDGFIIINADNILSKNYLSTMNDAFVANNQDKIITSYRNSTNFGSNILSCMYGLMFLCECRFQFRGRTALNVSSRVCGTGYMFSSKIVENGWNYVSLTEDWEFTADQVMQGNKIIYCSEAMFFDEQPTRLSIMCKQRLRWAKGHLFVFSKYFGKLFKSLFSGVFR